VVQEKAQWEVVVADVIEAEQEWMLLDFAVRWIGVLD
jgi:hypothetical protein